MRAARVLFVLLGLAISACDIFLIFVAPAPRQPSPSRRAADERLIARGVAGVGALALRDGFLVWWRDRHGLVVTRRSATLTKRASTHLRLRADEIALASRGRHTLVAWRTPSRGRCSRLMVALLDTRTLALVRRHELERDCTRRALEPGIALEQLRTVRGGFALVEGGDGPLLGSGLRRNHPSVRVLWLDASGRLRGRTVIALPRSTSFIAPLAQLARAGHSYVLAIAVPGSVTLGDHPLADRLLVQALDARGRAAGRPRQVAASAPSGLLLALTAADGKQAALAWESASPERLAPGSTIGYRTKALWLTLVRPGARHWQSLLATRAIKQGGEFGAEVSLFRARGGWIITFNDGLAARTLLVSGKRPGRVRLLAAPRRSGYFQPQMWFAASSRELLAAWIEPSANARVPSPADPGSELFLRRAPRALTPPGG